MKSDSSNANDHHNRGRALAKKKVFGLTNIQVTVRRVQDQSNINLARQTPQRWRSSANVNAADYTP